MYSKNKGKSVVFNTIAVKDMDGISSDIFESELEGIKLQAISF